MRFLMALLAAFVFIFGFDFVFHGIYMKDAWYDPYEQFWRKPEDVPMQWMIVSQFLMALAVGVTLLLSGKQGIAAGLTAGACVAIPFASLYLVFYAVQPFPGGMVVSWILGAAGECLLAGGLIGAIYKTRRL